MNKKIIVLLLVLISIISIANVCASELNKSYDFNGLFSMDISSSDNVEINDALADIEEEIETYGSDLSWKINDGVSVFYYYDSMDVTLNIFELSSIFFDSPENDGNLTILKNNHKSNTNYKTFDYLVGVSSDDKTVFVGSNDLDTAKEYADTIAFN